MKDMKKEIFHKILRIILLIIGAVITVNGIGISFVSGAVLGIVSTLIAGLSFLLIGVFYKFVRFRVHWIFKVLFIGLVVTVGSVVIFVYSFGFTDTVTYKEDAVIVLGAGLRGEKLSLILRNRLDAAVEYYNENPEVVIVVSGGQGPDEDIPEAEAMERYLYEQGIPLNKIIKEDKSTSTEENFKFSKELLENRFDEDYTVGFITDDFHIYRAGKTAERVGFEGITHTHSSGAVSTFLPNGFREFCAVMHMWVFG